MALTITAGYTFAAAEKVTPTKLNTAQTGLVITQATNRLIGRTTASSGSIEEITPGAGLDFSSLGLSVGWLDTNSSHRLRIACGSDLSADRTVTITPGDANRTLTISGDATLNQDVSTTASPTFAGLDSPIGQVTPRAGSFTTLAASGAVSLTRTGLMLTNTQTANNAVYAQFENNTGATAQRLIFGLESTAGSIVSGTGAGDSWIGSNSNDNFHLLCDGAIKASVSSTGLAVTGALSCTGALSKGSGTFKIDHPLPALKDTRYLVHSFIEGPRVDLIYRGTARLQAGRATVNIDADVGMTEGTFEALATNPQVWPVNRTGWTRVRGEVQGNILTLEAEQPVDDTVSWLIIAERHDDNIKGTSFTDAAGKVILEPEKIVDLAESKRRGRRVTKAEAEALRADEAAAKQPKLRIAAPAP